MRKGPKGQGQALQSTDHGWTIFETGKSSDVGRDKEAKVDEHGRHSQCRRGR